MCGLAFAGKTTLGSQLAERRGAVIVSLDQINAERGLHGGIGIPGEEWVRTHREALSRLESLLEDGASVVIDDTNCFRWLRDNYREVASRFGIQTTVIHLEVTLEEAMKRCMQNNNEPTRSIVTEHVLRDLASKFEIPQADERVAAYRSTEDIDLWLTQHFPQE